MSKKTFIEIIGQSDSFHSLSGVSEEEIRQAENTLGLVFADDYREYLLTYGIASIRGHEFTGLGSSSRLSVVDNTVQEREQHPDLPGTLYVVEQCNIDGLVILQDENGDVFSVAPGLALERISGSLCEYLE